MILTRFCSFAEYDKFQKGETLVNTTDHGNFGRGGSESVGFCFSPDIPGEAWEYLKGIVDYDICLIIDINEKLLTPSFGKYRDVNSEDMMATCIKREYCMTEYSNKVATLVSVLYPHQFATKTELASLELMKELISKGIIQY